MNTAEVGSLAGTVGGSAALALGMNVTTIPGDGAIPIDKDGTYLLTKGSAAAITLAAPVAASVGRRIKVIAGSNFAHVVTSAAANIGDGTTGLNTTMTFAAFIGASFEIVCNAANQWVTTALVAVTPA